MTTQTEQPTKSKKKIFSRLLNGPKNFQQKLYKSEYLYMIFCFLAPIALVYIMYVIKGIYPFTTGSPLVLDLNAQYVSFFEQLRRFVYGDGSLLYSFSRTLGGEFMGMYAYYIASPLSYIVAIFPQDRIQEAILCILLLKSGLCGLTFSIMLHNHSQKPKKLIIFIFSMLYALSAYAIVHQNNTMWIDALILLPLLVLGLEKLIIAKKFKLYVITLTLTLICNYYIGYMVCIFCVLYFLYYYFSKSKDQINPTNEKLHFVRSSVRFALFSLLSAAIAAFMLIAAYYSLGFGKTEFSNPNWSLTAKFDILDFLTKFLPGAYDTVEPDGMPFVYCGIITLFLVPVYFVSKRISTREKIASAGILSVMLISFFTNPIDLIWHGFSTPNWLNGRYSFLFIFLLLVLAYKGFACLKEAGIKFLFAIGAILVLFVAVAQKFKLDSYITSNNKLRTLECIWFSIFFIIATLTLLSLITRKASSKRLTSSISLVLAAIVCLELLCNGAMGFLDLNKDVVFANYADYYNRIGALRPVVNNLRDYDRGFYRFEKTSHRTRNDNSALGIKGLTNSTSTLNAKAIDFLNDMGYMSRSHLSMYKGGTPFSDSFLGIKYVIDSDSSTRFDGIYKEIEEIGSKEYKVMENPYALSLAFGVNSDIKEHSLKTESDKRSYCFFEEYNDLAEILSGYEDEPIFNPVYGMTTKCGSCTELESTTQLSYTTENKKGQVTFTYTAPYTGKYYFYSPISKGTKYPTLTIAVGSGSDQNYMGGEGNHIVYAGTYNKNDKITLKIKFPQNTEVVFNNQVDFLWYLDEEAYEATMTKILENPQLNIESSSTDSKITGSIRTKNKDQMILTTIPFDEGWNVYVDGKKVDTYETLDTLLAFDIPDKGNHSVTFEYMPKCYIVGFTVSAIGMMLFIALCVLDTILRRTKLKNHPILAARKYTDDFWLLDDDEVTSVSDISDIKQNSEPNIPQLEEPKFEEEQLISEVTIEDITAPTSDNDSENSEQINEN